MILFRHSVDTAEEESICRRYLTTVNLRSQCHGKIVIGRYSVLPYYQELEEDLKRQKSRLINSYQEHRYIANFEWYNDFKNETFPTYYDYDFSSAPEGSYVVKGKTNSRKFKWNTEMFANSKIEALNIASHLSGDSLIGPQGIIYRKYIPLQNLETGLNGLPFSYEFRFFYLYGVLIAYGYYWSNSSSIIYSTPFDLVKFANNIAAKIAKLETCNFFVLDVARTSDGDPILVEINDAQMSGLSCIDTCYFYSRLSYEIF